MAEDKAPAAATSGPSPPPSVVSEESTPSPHLMELTDSDVLLGTRRGVKTVRENAGVEHLPVQHA